MVIAVSYMESERDRSRKFNWSRRGGPREKNVAACYLAVLCNLVQHAGSGGRSHVNNKIALAKRPKSPCDTFLPGTTKIQATIDCASGNDRRVAIGRLRSTALSAPRIEEDVYSM